MSVPRHRSGSYQLGLAGFVGLISSCAPEHVFVAWTPPPEGEVAYLVRTRGSEVLSAHGPFEGEDTRPLAHRDLEVEGSSLYEVTLRRAQILERVPTVDPNDFSALWFEAKGFDCTSVFRRDGARLIPLVAEIARVKVLKGVEFVDVAPSSLPLVVGLPVDEVACVGEAPPRFTPYLAEAQAPELERPSEPTAYAFRFAASVSPSRLVVARASEVYVFDRGASEALDASRRWSVLNWPHAEGPFDGWGIGAVALDGGRSTETRIRLLLVLEAVARVTNLPLSDVVELVWTPLGFMPPRGLARVDGRLNDVGLLEDGRALALGEDGAFLVQSSTSAQFEPVPGLDFGRADLEVVGRGPSDLEPVILLDGGHGLRFGRALGGERFRSEPSPFTLGGAKHLIEFASAEGTTYYSDTESPELLERPPDGSRRRMEIEVPDELASCGSEPDPCGVRRLTGGRLAVAATPRGTLVVVPTDCAAIIEVEPERGCARRIEHDGPDWPAVSGRARPSLSATPFGVVLGDDQGLLLEARF